MFSKVEASPYHLMLCACSGHFGYYSAHTCSSVPVDAYVHLYGIALIGSTSMQRYKINATMHVCITRSSACMP